MKNRLLVSAVAVELMLLFGFLYWTPLAQVLGHTPPTVIGAALAVLAFPAVIVTDVIHKGPRRNHMILG